MAMTPAEKQRLLAKFNGNPQADARTVRQLETDASLRLPEDYARFLQELDGGEGFIGTAYLILWRAGELLDMNRAYQVAEYAPGLFLIGSNAGGEAFAFDTRSDTRPIVSVPFVGMALKEALPVASSFTAFLEELFRVLDDDQCEAPTISSKSHVQDFTGKEIFEIHPVILGGSPTDLANKAILTREQHIEAVQYWNKVVRDLRSKR
jgi:hypothetical protein